MRLYPMLLLAGLKLILVSGEKRLDVSVLGTTLGPGYSRQGEKGRLDKHFEYIKKKLCTFHAPSPNKSIFLKSLHCK